MNFAERIDAVLHHARPDTVPFAPYDNLVPRGDFARELRDRGMGLCLRLGTIWSERPNVVEQTRSEGDVQIATYITPKGSVSMRRKTHLGRIADGSSIVEEGLIKGVEDYEPVLFMIDDTIFHLDNSVYSSAARDVGSDGVIFHGGVGPPYDGSRGYFGSVYGLAQWVYAQQDEPLHFARLIEALERSIERRFPLLLDCPAEIIGTGAMSGHYGPRQFTEYVLPFYKSHVARLHARGKICTLHAHASNLGAFAELIGETGVDVVEAFTPPPIGDLSLADARAAWGPDTIIWVNFPETIFWYGADQTRDYTLDLLGQDPRPDRLVIGMTEMGTYGVTDDESERVFKAGMRAIMDAIDEFSGARL